MTVEDTFFNELRDWSQIKLRIVEKYLSAYMNKRGGSNPAIHYIDGFAGAGYYGTEGAALGEGSPIRAAKLAERVVRSGKPNRLVCHFVEIRRDRYQALSEALTEFDPETVHVYLGAFRKHLNSILQTIGSAPAIFFLDPFGVKHVTMDDLSPILRRRDTEVLVIFNTPRLRKLAGFEDSTSPDAKAKISLVSRVLGDDPEDPSPLWLQEWHESGKNGIEWEEWAAHTYAERLVRASPELQYAVPYPVRESFGANPKYYFIFATRSIHAIPLMNDFICTEEDDLFSNVRARTPVTQLGFYDLFKQTERDSRLLDLIDEIHAYGMQNQNCSRRDIMNHFMLIHFGEFKQKHYRDAVNKLVEANRAEFGLGPKESAPVTFI